MSRWRTTLGVVLPRALGGILTGTVLAIARAAGETAPLLFTSLDLHRNQRDADSAARAAEHPGRRSSPTPSRPTRRPRARLGGRARADGVRARGEPAARGSLLARSRRKLGAMTEEERRDETRYASGRRERRSRSRSASRRRRPAARRVFDIAATSTSSTAATPALKGVNIEIYKNLITAIIGPSGCGKSTFIRCLNRMNDLVPGVKRRRASSSTTASDLYGAGVDPVEVRRRIGMVFQKPEPVPEVDLRQRRLGAARPRDEEGPRRARRARAPRRGALGRGQGPPQEERARRSPAASSSGCASRARSRSSPR